MNKKSAEFKLLNIDELSDFLRVKKTWVYSRTRLSGPEAIPTIRVGKYLRFRVADVLAWLEKQDNKGV